MHLHYENDENLILTMHVPADEVPEAFNELMPHLPKEVSKVPDCFENNYVHGRIRRFLHDVTAV